MPVGDPDGRVARLHYTRDLLAAALDDCESARDLPALSREYRITLAELDGLTSDEDISVVDQLAQRRRAKGPPSATGTEE